MATIIWKIAAAGSVGIIASSLASIYIPNLPTPFLVAVSFLSGRFVIDFKIGIHNIYNIIRDLLRDKKEFSIIKNEMHYHIDHEHNNESGDKQ